ncbi:MAG TPA: response regulator transcription factor [Chitinispirillaceae bacterium]|nr:response regulator transcription factor [Chitinispirillaceae bacterium]
MFSVVIHAEVSTIITAGIQSSICALEDVHQCVLCTKKSETFEQLKTKQFSVLIVILNDAHTDETDEIGETHYDFIKQVKIQFDRIRIIAIAPKISKEVVFQTIKNGANGFLASDATVQELTEAVYTIYSGHEYFSSSITSLLVNNYVEAMRNESGAHDNPASKLGKREIEILTLWGNGYTNVEIAERLFISVRTVESHKNHIMQKLGTRTTVDLLKFAIRNNIISI